MWGGSHRTLRAKGELLMYGDQAEGRGKKRMKWAMGSALAVAAAVALGGCATYDYGPGYGYTYGYNDGYYTPYSYDNGYYYDSGPGYVAPSVGFGFTYRDRDNYDRDYYYRHRNDYRDHNDYRDRNDYRGNNDQWRGDRNAAAHSAAPWPTGPNDPWGGTNKPNDRTSQQ